jgi:hypothetical protein
MAEERKDDASAEVDAALAAADGLAKVRAP